MRCAWERGGDLAKLDLRLQPSDSKTERSVRRNGIEVVRVI